ncbi:MAG: hypothetical protein U0231_12780 [Nitrospiraceae bacterium]
MANLAAGVVAGIPAHKKGAKDCLLYYNDARDIRLIAGRAKLCETCRKKFRGKKARSACEWSSSSWQRTREEEIYDAQS